MRRLIRLELAELRAYLPVRGMQKPDHGALSPFRCIAICVRATRGFAV
jgi:hypothetical protein